MLAALQTFLESSIKQGPKALAGIAVATGMVIFMPENLASSLGVNAFRTSNRGVFGWSFIASTSLLATYALWWVGGLIKSHYKKQRLRQMRESQLYELTAEELRFLAPYICEDTSTRNAAIDNGVARGLEAKEIIFRASVVGAYHQIPFNIRPWACRYLKSRRELLEGLATKNDRDEDDDC